MVDWMADLMAEPRAACWVEKMAASMANMKV